MIATERLNPIGRPPAAALAGAAVGILGGPIGLGVLSSGRDRRGGRGYPAAWAPTGALRIVLAALLAISAGAVRTAPGAKMMHAAPGHKAGER